MKGAQLYQGNCTWLYFTSHDRLGPAVCDSNSCLEALADAKQQCWWEGWLPGAPTGGVSLAVKEDSTDISALFILVSGRRDIIKDPVCLPGCEVLEQLPVGFAGDINAIRFRAAPIYTALASPRQLETKSGFKISRGCTK